MIQPTYKDKNEVLERRVEDLLSRMTLPEKVGQVMQLDGSRGDLNVIIDQMNIGSLLHILW